MRLLVYLTTFFMTILLSVSGEDHPIYKIVDLGLFGTDSSYADQVNEKGQVLGFFSENNRSYVFLWDEFEGIKVITPPEHHIFYNIKLNNEGQIAGVMYQSGSNTPTIFYWDIHLGFWEIESSAYCQLIEFNDKGQILGKLNGQVFIWDHGKKTNLSSLFFSQIPGDWGALQEPHLNNIGHVAFSVFDYKSNNCKFFIWDGNFIPVNLNKEIVELDDEDNFVRFLDDEDNMILDLHLSRREERYFISPYKIFFISCNGCESIRNGIPISLSCLPSKLKKDRQGNFYFLRGIEIRRLIHTSHPYYISNIHISDQNSKGYVVGSTDTLYGSHAFLAIPDR